MEAIKFTEQIIINEKSEKVFDFTQNYNNRLKWDTFLKQADLIDGATIADKGKIKLTNAELIKALFILKAQEKKNGKKVEELKIQELSYEWNEIENALQDNRIWYFIANKEV